MQSLCNGPAPHAIYENNVETPQDQCREDRGDEEAVDHLPTIFKDGVADS